MVLLFMTAVLSSKAEEERLHSQLLTRRCISPEFSTKVFQPANMDDVQRTVPKEDETKKRAGERVVFCFCFFPSSHFAKF